MSQDYIIDDVIYPKFTTRAFATGIPTVLAGSPTVEVYEDANATPIVEGAGKLVLGIDHASIVGLNLATITLSAANGFEAGKGYTLVIKTGTVGGVSVVGEVVYEFSIQANPVNWARVTAPTTANDLSATDIQLVATVTDVTNQITAAAIRAEMDSNSTKLANIPAGTMPTQAEVLSIQNNTRTVIGIPTVAERPDSGSTRLKIYLNNYDTIGNMEAPDSAPTVAVENEAGTTRSGNIQHPTTHVAGTAMVNLSAGRYWIEYDLDNADSLESLTFTFTVIEGGVTRILDRVMLVVDTTSVDFTAADRTKLDTLHDTRIPGIIQPQTGDGFARLGAPAGASVSADVLALKNETTLIVADTNELQADDVPALIAALKNLSTADILAMIYEGTETFQDLQRLTRAALVGKIAGAATSTVTARDIADTKNRITATVDADGNRSAVTTDAT